MQLVARRGCTLVWRGGSLWWWVVSFVSELWCFQRCLCRAMGRYHVSVCAFRSWALGRVWASCGAAALTEPREWQVYASALQHQQYAGLRSTLGWLKLTDLNKGQKSCLLGRLLRLLICWWLCNMLDKRRVVFWGCDKPQWYALCFTLALSALKWFLTVGQMCVFIQY